MSLCHRRGFSASSLHRCFTATGFSHKRFLSLPPDALSCVPRCLFPSVWRHPRAVLWSHEAVWSGRIAGHHAVPVPRGLRWPRLLQYWGKVIRSPLMVIDPLGSLFSLNGGNERKYLCPLCFDSAFYTSGRWKSSIQRRYFYFVEIMNVDIWQNISPSNKNVSSSLCLTLPFIFCFPLSLCANVYETVRSWLQVKKEHFNYVMHML